MSKYSEVVYGNYPKTSFPRKLVDYLLTKHWPKSASDHKYYKHESYSHFQFSSQPQKVRVLDVGCGNLTYIKEGFRCFHFADGVDTDIIYERTLGSKLPGTVTEVKKRPGAPLDFNKNALPFDDNTYDIVFTKSVIEHLTNIDFFLQELKRVLKPNGVLIVLTPAWEYNYKDFFNDYTHVQPFHRKGLQDALKINDFKNVNVQYHYHLPWLWEKPWLLPLAKFLSLFSHWKWQDKDQTKHRINIRFSQEIQLLGVATK